MLLRLLLLAALAWLVWRLWRGLPYALAARRRQRHAERMTVMSPCKRCGVYLPAETLSESGHCGRCSH